MSCFRRSALACAAILCLSAPAAAEDLDFLLINASSSDITEFQVSPQSESRWSSNLMPSGYVLPAGNEVSVLIQDGRDHCEYDILAVFADGAKFEEFGANLCDLGEWTFTD
jgi:hypothetical protein